MVDPEQRAPALVHEAEPLPELEAGHAQDLVDQVSLAGGEHQQIPLTAAGGLDDRVPGLGLQEAAERTGDAVGRDLGPAEPGAPLGLGLRVQGLDLLAGERTAPGGGDGLHHPARRDGLLEGSEPDTRGLGAHVHELERVPQVGSVGPEAVHRLLVRHARQRQGDVVPTVGLHEVHHDGLEQGGHVRLVHERRLDVDLRELRLTVGAQVLVAEAARDLVVAVHAAHHQDLLEELRTLGKREEVASSHAAGHEVVPGSFRRRPGQDRRLDLGEALALQVPSHAAEDARPLLQDLLHALPAKVQIAVA